MSADTPTQILDAADSRFRIYGFGKTTMAEIASDIEMSTANLYRYYENKLAIGSAMADRCFSERNAFLSEVISRPALNESQRLEVFVLEMLAYMHAQFSHEPKISELVDVIIKKRPYIIQAKIATDKRLIAIILQQGNDGGEFAIENIEQMSSYVLAAIAKFSSPFFMAMFPIEELEYLAKGVVGLILNGLVKR